VGERLFVVRLRDGQRPAGRFVPFNNVFDSLTGKHETPIHRLATVACRDRHVEGRLGRWLHGRKGEGGASKLKIKNADGLRWLSGHAGDDAKHYQERDVRRALNIVKE
jgi:hypothetical protein